MLRRFPLLASLSVLAFGAGAVDAHAEIVRLHGRFVAEHGATEVVKGGVKATLDTSSDTLKYRIHYSGLSGAVMVAHLHGPADEGQDAGVLVPIPGPYVGHLKGTLTLTPDQVKDVLDGKTYVNLHTAEHKDGEARAQLVH
ncbi:CHRD domain-containing protein [Acidomonas methanolica]|uniref:CHRD domain-containing protein n=1 Tax=Acidomonas methanolica NBRC 104435 TaxID=1231351 RepID=A0A023D4E3_ACIMT|nr:CHRD domain-containing protein [Acidomonas methanolica]MBU2653249.1 CHRD domain-containing protein [Acidomonas methanolica]TCS32198.1 CHRD domain-containing protein [Acidomonas methanolica]GAJ29002.1 hypothetical protein Amme_041_036 [Acidomonas methanolica NBRC 104435]GBQ50938.1 hypothetical protein AA0498_1339 [Acidomonas methanolica]GEK97632.1 CHRD domain-containing protein [Acidomonas methanolica NBRC 104435]